jgi:hypothetical protein
MVALQNDSPSLVEMGVRKLVDIRAERHDKKAQRDPLAWPRRTWRVVSDILGTLVALVFFVIAAFLVGSIVGFAVAGVAMLLLDFKVSVSRRARAANERR